MAKKQAAKKRTAKKAAEPGTDLEWLRTLEKQVAAATERLAGLREENERLGGRVEELETALDDAAAQARQAAAQEDGDGDGDGGAESAEAWREERRKIRGRVERLTETLEGLLQD